MVALAEQSPERPLVEERVGIGEDDVPFALAERVIMLILDIDVPAPGLVDAKDVGVEFVSAAPAVGGLAMLRFGRDGVEAAARDEVHDPLVGAVAIFQCHLLGQHLHADDRLGRDAADFAEAGDALAVEQHHRPLAAASAAAAGLRRDRVEQLGEGACAERADVAAVEHHFRLDVADHRSALALAGDDNLLAFLFLDIIGIARVDPGRGRLRLLAGCGLLGEERLVGDAGEQGDGGKAGKAIHGHLELGFTGQRILPLRPCR